MSVTPEARVLLHGLYRRLLRNGEDSKMIRRALTVHPLEANVATAKRFLALHRTLAECAAAKAPLRFYHIRSIILLRMRERSALTRLFFLRVRMLSLAALSDLLVLVLCLSISFFLYQMYRLARVGLTRAEEKYRTLAIPIVQTIEALEETERLRKHRRTEMESDIIQQRK